MLAQTVGAQARLTGRRDTGADTTTRDDRRLTDVDRDVGEGRSIVITAYREYVERPLPYAERACTSKLAYASRREASSRVRHGRHQDGTLHPYRCGFCGGWHLGHRIRRR